LNLKLNIMLTIIIFILILSLLVFVHEVGHFVVARKFGVKAEEFGLGFPPRGFGFYKNTEGKWKFVFGSKEVRDAADTVYSVNLIPLGGFVKIKGENGDSDDPDSFMNKKIWQRASILAAGVTMNMVLAAALLSVGFMIGLPQALDGVNKKAEISDKNIQIIEVLPDSPAARSGFKFGDTILSVDNNEFTDNSELQDFVNGKVNQELEYKVKRGEGEKTFKVTPEIMEATGKGGIGIAIAETGTVKYPWYMAIWEGIKATIILTWLIMAALYELLKNLILGNGVTADIAGPVGIATMTGQAARMGLIYLIQFTALLSINLAIVNFLPIPALDGGRILFLVIEKIKRRPVRRELEALLHNVGFILLMALVVLVTFRDVMKLGDKFKMIWERLIG